MCFQYLNVICISLHVPGKERRPAQNQAQRLIGLSEDGGVVFRKCAHILGIYFELHVTNSHIESENYFKKGYRRFGSTGVWLNGR